MPLELLAEEILIERNLVGDHDVPHGLVLPEPVLQRLAPLLRACPLDGLDEIDDVDEAWARQGQPSPAVFLELQGLPPSRGGSIQPPASCSACRSR